MICEAGINPEVVKTIYNGVDIKKFTRDHDERERMRKTLGFKEDTVVFGFVGNIIERKGADFILKAAKTLISEERDIHFLFVGGDPSTHYFINTIAPLIEELPIPGKVTFIPAVSDTKPYYDSMDIYLMTSKQEPFGRVNIEAMAMELPVIATAIDGNLEVIVPDETGFLFELDDISAFCQILDYCVNNRDRLISMGKAGRKRVVEHFTQEICSQKCESVILATLNYIPPLIH
jgi:glycosyltransferase involved in cell wall biosynthesis